MKSKQLDPLLIINALPDNGDGQENTLARLELPKGVKVLVRPWDEMVTPRYELSFRIDDDDYGYEIEVPADFEPLELSIPLVDHMFAHGRHTLGWRSMDLDTGNIAVGEPTNFYVDIIDPNVYQQPDQLLLPADLPDGDITQDYLEQHGGVTFTLPAFLDPKPGDSFRFFIDDELILDRPAVAPYSFLVDKTVFAGLQGGELVLTYSISDRAGNRTINAVPKRVDYHTS
ncbi:hypothetical protein [Pseudomonas japonica]|uniref:Uncharacterized protein n=1 Tax=Pseudomonas japonica TaxID=256466 RepID=A0A239ABN6_9PSED|nr:hypothetical protein [Pseudomonas japonica]SNR92468.1 hypothetical protein SAMN05444352_101311 [Pseudomonas japonica]